MDNNLNCFNLTGTVLGSGVKGDKYPKLWIRVQLDPITRVHGDGQPEDVTLFLNFDLDANENSNKGRHGKHVQHELQTKKFIMINDVTFTNIPRSKKVKKDDGTEEWVTTDEPGLKTNIKNIVLASTRFDSINTGFITGTVVKQSENKLILKQQYRIPGEKGFTYKDRELPVLLDTDIKQDILNKKIFVQGKLAHNKTADKTYIVTTKFVTHE